MSGQDRQLVTMYEVNGMTPEQIASCTGFDPLAVKASLANFSLKYRKDVAAVDSNTTLPVAPGPSGAPPIVEDISNDDFDLIKQAALRIALQSEETHMATSGRMLRFLWNEKKGRNNTNKVAGIQYNVVNINAEILAARDAVRRALDPARVIDVPTETEKMQSVV